MPAKKSPLEHRLSPEEKALAAFSNEFLRQLGMQFGFDGTDHHIAQSMRSIAEGYFAVQVRPKSPEYRKQAFREYSRWKKDVEKFRNILENAQELGIDADMDIVAQLSARKSISGNKNSTNSQTDAAGKFGQLMALLNLLAATAEYGKHIYSERPGPKIDQALEMLVRRAANFWILELGRKFTIDHHKGTGTTKSFLFLRTLTSNVDADISDTQLVSAMRADRKFRRNIGGIA